ncbi:MAG TPA: GvpL/GvpF family gas vesicle protein [Gaiellaceae bacterium]
MSEPTIYVYGVAPVDSVDQLPRSVPGLDPRFPVEVVRSGALAALVSQVEHDELERSVADAERGDLLRLEPLVRAHENVLSLAQGVGVVLPFRFGIVVRGHAEVLDLVEKRGADLAAQLERLRDVREWGVKALIATEPLEASVIAGAPHLVELSNSASDGTGHGFFARKRLEREVEALMREEAAELATTVHTRVATYARQSALNPPQPRELSGYRDEMILNGVYLVERRAEAALDSAVRALRSEFAERGLRLELTGPWPPFNFVDEAMATDAR